MNRKWPVTRWVILLASALSIATLFLPYLIVRNVTVTSISNLELIFYTFSLSSFSHLLQEGLLPAIFSNGSLLGVVLVAMYGAALVNVLLTLLLQKQKTRRIWSLILSVIPMAGAVFFLVDLLMAFGVLSLSMAVLAILSLAAFIASFFRPPVIEAEPPEPIEVIDSFPAPPKQYAGLTCLAGEYAGGVFPITDNGSIKIGRDPTQAHLIVQGPKISRLHCTVEYLQNEEAYVVTDHSSNGTFTKDGQRLNANTPTVLPHGTVILIGNEETSFKLN